MQWFGFSDNGVPIPDTAGMSDEALPTIGGLFRDENLGEAKITPLDDSTYRRVLAVRALATNRDTADISLAYYAISMLLGRVPSVFEIRDSDSPTGTPLAKRTVELVVSSASVSTQEIQLILYMRKCFVPAGITFFITQV